MTEDPLLSIEDFMDGWGVTREFITRHVQYPDHNARTLPALETEIIEDEFYFRRTAIRDFFKALTQRRKFLAMQNATARRQAA